MNAWVIAPILAPAIAAPLLILLRGQSIAVRRAVSMGATLVMLAIAVALYSAATDGVVRPYYLGAWPAPYGIVIVLDRLSATMVLLASALGAIVSLYAMSGWDARGKHFHALLQFQIMGVNGAFLTGDVFNLFVFFEVMLIASYGMLLHGGGARRLTAGFQYVAINLIASTLFLFAVGLIYGVTGTLNMADLAVKVAAATAGDAALLKTGALLLFLVFATKAALAPLHWWLPTAYAAASAPAAAFFAVMTKVGAYAIIRVYTLVFGPEAGLVADVAAPWIIPAALVTMVVGAFGVLASRSLADLIVFAVLWSMGSLLVALGAFNVSGLTAALYYALHSTMAAAALFLLADIVADRRGPMRDTLKPAPRFARSDLAGGAFFLAAIAMAGLPPLSGFIGKILILDATRAAPSVGWIWGVLLASSLVVVIGFGRAGSMIFWKSEAVGDPDKSQQGASSTGYASAAAVALTISATVLLTAFAGPITRHMEAAARQAMDVRGYVSAVLGPAASTQFEKGR